MTTRKTTTRVNKATANATATAAVDAAHNEAIAAIVTQDDALNLFRRNLNRLTKDTRKATDTAASLACDLIAVVTAGNGAPVELVPATKDNKAIVLTRDMLSTYFAGGVTGKAATAFINAIASQSTEYAAHIKTARDRNKDAGKAKDDPFAEAEARATAKANSNATEAVRKQLGRALLFAGYALSIDPAKVDLTECKASRGVFYVTRIDRAPDGVERARKAIAVTTKAMQTARNAAKRAAGVPTSSRASQPAKGSGNVTTSDTVTHKEALRSISLNQATAVNPANAAALIKSCAMTLERVMERKLTLDADASMALVALITQAQSVLAGQPAPVTKDETDAA